MPELILSLGAMALLMVAAFGGDGLARAIGWGAVACSPPPALALLSARRAMAALGFDGLYIADSFAAFAKLLIYIAAAVCVIVAPGFFERAGGYRAEYPILILFAAVGMGMMVSAGDLLTLYVGLELQSLSAYVLASFMRRDARSAEAGLKYFVLGALASGILLYGISLLYGFTGTTLFARRSRTALANGIGTGQLFGMVFVFAGLAFKISAVPFHMWTPDVYEGAPTPVTAFFASAPKVAGMALADARRGRRDGLGHRCLAPDRDLLGIGLDDPRRRRRDRPDQHEAAARLLVDQQCRLRAVRPRRRHAAGRGRDDDLYGCLCRDDPGQLRLRAADAHRRW